jgi:hypothetical protein
MARATLPQSVVEALQAAGATEEMIAAASGAFGTLWAEQRAKATERQRECRARKRAREAAQCDVTPTAGRDVTRDEALPSGYLVT